MGGGTPKRDESRSPVRLGWVYTQRSRPPRLSALVALVRLLEWTVRDNGASVLHSGSALFAVSVREVRGTFRRAEEVRLQPSQGCSGKLTGVEPRGVHAPLCFFLRPPPQRQGQCGFGPGGCPIRGCKTSILRSPHRCIQRNSQGGHADESHGDRFGLASG